MLEWFMDLSLPGGLRARVPTPADAPGLAELLTRARPDSPRTAAEQERLDALRLPGDAFGRVVVEAGSGADGEEGAGLVGLAEYGVPRMDGHDGWLNVEFATLRPELGPRLLEWAEAGARAAGARTLVTRVKEGWPERAVYEARGYTEHDRMWISTLDLRTLDLSSLPAREARLAERGGLRLRPLSDFGPLDEPRQRQLYALIAELLRDVPSTTPISVWPFGRWQAVVAPRLTALGGLWLAVTEAGEWVGLSELHQPVESRPGTLHNGLTGVRPAWRGQGVAHALKLRAAQAALERGFTHARTSNHAVNRPMLAINEQLGFVREAATLTLRRDIG